MAKTEKDCIFHIHDELLTLQVYIKTLGRPNFTNIIEEVKTLTGCGDFMLLLFI